MYIFLHQVFKIFFKIIERTQFAIYSIYLNKKIRQLLKQNKKTQKQILE